MVLKWSLSKLGGWGGAIVGAKVGAAIGMAGGPVGMAVGGFIGAAVGYMIAENAAGQLYDMIDLGRFIDNMGKLVDNLEGLIEDAAKTAFEWLMDRLGFGDGVGGLKR
jgi:uncharacterized protein YqgC (DUF456 family)